MALPSKDSDWASRSPRRKLSERKIFFWRRRTPLRHTVESAMPETSAVSPSRKLDPLAAVLTFVLPGLGQVIQGRIAKGFLFFFSLYGLFFYGMAMGQWKNVWIPQPEDVATIDIFGYKLEGTVKVLVTRREYLGQFWMGAAAWPALVQYVAFDKTKETGPLFGSFQRCPPEDVINHLQRDGNKRWDLGWVFTVIAGVLNLLVIYDALAGPMVREEEESPPAIPPGGPAK